MRNQNFKNFKIQDLKIEKPRSQKPFFSNFDEILQDGSLHGLRVTNFCMRNCGLRKKIATARR